MEDTAQCVIISHQLGSTSEQEITDKLKEILHERNTQGFPVCPAFSSQGYGNIKEICVGPHNLALLLKNGGICRFTAQSKIHQVQPSTATPSQGTTTGGPSQASNRGNLPKFRRVMLTASSFDRFRRGERGVLLDRTRPMVAANAVPEELISQAQVVLQGKSREVIVRELQRTNLNVNEAVNNLLSRDDDEDEYTEAGEVMLPEELLSLLDPAGSNHSFLDSDLDPDIEYYMHRDAASRKGRPEKGEETRGLFYSTAERDKKAKDATPTAKSRWELDDQVEWWTTEGRGTPEGVDRFIMMAATASELLAVTDTGILYGWPWDETSGDLNPHRTAKSLIPQGDQIVQISTSRLRVMVLLQSGAVCSWVDPYLMGERATAAMAVKPVQLALAPDEVVLQLVVSDHLAVARTSTNAFHWIGLYPFTDRPKLWEKEKNRSKKHVTFNDTNSNEIKEGSEVRTKASPIYAAGSIAVNFNSHDPMIGVLMENVWTLTEVVRFRLLRPADYDKDFPEEAEEGSIQANPSGTNRKRRAEGDVFDSSPFKEEVWGVCDCIWIHEQQTQDVAIVKIVDGAYVGLEYTAGKQDMTYASSLSGNVCSRDSGPSNTGKIRLLRKDDVCLVSPKMKSSRSPKVMQKEPIKFTLNGATARKIISAVAESTGLRALTEKNRRLYITRCSVDGKILSEHLLPVFPPALYGQNGEAPRLTNYGEDGLLLLQDGNGAIHPLVRDAMMGFREPQALNLPNVRHFSFCVDFGPPSSEKMASTRTFTMVAITGPREDATKVQMPSLSQLVMFCDTTKMQSWLDVYNNIEDQSIASREILGERSDYGCNLLHAAIRLSVASKNRDDADPGTTHGIRLREDEMKMARDEARDLDQRWQRLIRANRSGEPPRDEPSVIQAAPIQDNNAVQSPGDPSKSQDMPMLENKLDGVISDPKERQRMAIEMVSIILNHPVVQPVIYQLLIHRDYGGLTPFQAALNIRAYGAATAIWETIKWLVYPPQNSGRPSYKMDALIFPSGSKPDDNPMFLLCYNDTCSFTWTGEEHINQDIFECRTCGLTGSLCCCTECAYTCHRNHDCKLKRTSPTAYCDCWEKCPCKALVAGNQDKREALMKELVKTTDLYRKTNNKGEHLLLFLVKTLGRQMAEQSNSNRRRRHPPALGHNDPSVVPEHDLDPPKFAKFALEACLSDWQVMKSLLEIGCREHVLMVPQPELTVFLNSQNGATHMDKFTYTLLVKCGDAVLGQVLNCFIQFANTTGPEQDPRFHENVNRFIRSIIRVYILLLVSSPAAAAVGIKGKNPNAPPAPERRIAAFSASGLFSIVRPVENTKEAKAQLLANVILRCREALTKLCPYAVSQLAYFATSVIAPVRYGIMRPTMGLQLQQNQDPLEALEKFLNSEYDLTTLIERMDSDTVKISRKRKSSRREASNQGQEEDERRDYSEESDDSEVDEPPSSRRHNSQSEGDVRRKNAISVVYDDELTDPGSSSSDSDPSDDEPEAHVMVEEDVEDDDTEEDDHDERYGENSEGDDNHNYEDGENDDQRNENDYPDASPTYEPTDPDETFALRDQQERRQEMDVDEQAPPAQEEDGEDTRDDTRDAVHSEDSSADNTDQQRDEENVPNEQAEERPRHSGIGRLQPLTNSDGSIRRAQLRQPQRFTMSWASRRSGFIESEDDTDERTQTRAPPSTQNNTGTAASPSDQRKVSQETVPSAQETSEQLALCFSFAVRMLSELIIILHERNNQQEEGLLCWGDVTTEGTTQSVDQTMQEAWDWMCVILDRLEAQFRFGNAIMYTFGHDVKPKSSKKQKNEKKETKQTEETTTANPRKEALEYFITTMRAQANEGGDDYPMLEPEIMHTIVYVFDAYLSYFEARSTYQQMYANRMQMQLPEYMKRKQTVNRFFQRSNSMCFPGALMTQAWNTLDKTYGKIPYAEKPHLLSPDVLSTTLFAPPADDILVNQYTEACKNTGIPNFMDTNFATLERAVKTSWPMENGPRQEIYQEQPMEPEDEEQEDVKPPVGMEKFTIEDVRLHLEKSHDNLQIAASTRWKNVIEMLARDCHQDLLTAYGGEIQTNHLLSISAKFAVRQGIFRRGMDKFRSQQSKDLAFDVHRDPVLLIKDAVFQLNQTYVRRLNTPKGRDDPPNNTPLGSGRVKVRFHDEPGEGTGVARSFYTALAEALMNTRKFPFENLGWEGEDYLYGNGAPGSNPLVSYSSRDRPSAVARIAVIRDRGSASAILSRKRPAKRTPLSADADPYPVDDIAGAEQRFTAGNYKTERVSETIARQRPAIAEAIFIKVRQIRSSAAARITGMIVDMPVSTVMHCLSSLDLFKQYVEDAVTLLLKVGRPADLALLADQQDRPVQEGSVPHPMSDDQPLFVRTCKRGLFTPVPGKMSPMRINAFRNVGRIIGLCLLQGELFPLKLSRHVLKYILNRPLRWLDLQFYDMVLWESLRQTMNPENNDDYYRQVDLTFTVDETYEEPDGTQRSVCVPLKEGGEDIPVTRANVVEYVYKFVEYKMLSPDQVQCYSAIRQGVSDAIPMELLDGLTAEDLRLLLCGTDTVCISTLQAVTSFSDESHASAEILDKFKGWFWSVVDGLSMAEKQELIFFWTGAPSLPTTPEGLQPQPTVMIRPPDDLFLPTANTCISRLYVPLYSSKKLLRAKLQLAIKAKNFGFV